MADQQGKRWVLISVLHGAVERTEEQIAELKAARLFTRDAAAPGDPHHNPPAPPAPPAVPPPRGPFTPRHKPGG